MMFYTQLFVPKRGTLAKIWLAAHWEKKLNKTHVFECNLETTIKDIISPKVKLGLRTSGHLLLGVVRIYSRKAKYLLADCSEAQIRIKIAFRPGQTDLPAEGLEATAKAITLNEDFTAFDFELPHPSNVDVVNHFSLNQCRSEEITLKEDVGRGSLNFADFGDESLGNANTLLYGSFESFEQHGDAFGDEDRGFDILDFLNDTSDYSEHINFVLEVPQNEAQESLTQSSHHQIGFPDGSSRDPVEAETPALNETTLVPNAEVAFALEPVAITPNSEKKLGKRKCKLIVDQAKELSSESIREQLSDYSDLVAPLDMAPPTVQLMQWKETGAAETLSSQPCCAVVNPQLKEIFAKSIFQVKYSSVREEVEVMRQEGQEAPRDLSNLDRDVSAMDLSVSSEEPHNTELTAMDDMNDSVNTCSGVAQDETRSEVSHPDLPSEDSMFVHPSYLEAESQLTSLQTQSVLDSQDFEERRIARRAQKLHNALKLNHSSSDPRFSLKAFCEGSARSQAATTFYCCLLLKKQQAIELQQNAPYEDIFITPGPEFYN